MIIFSRNKFLRDFLVRANGIPTAIYAKDLRTGNVLVGGSGKVQNLSISKYFFYLKHYNRLFPGKDYQEYEIC